MDSNKVKPKRTMTEKQKAARIANLANGRKKRMEMIKHKKEQSSSALPEEYDISSNDGSLDESDSSSDSDNDAFVISKAKKKQTKPVTRKEKHSPDRNLKEHKSKSNHPNENLKGEVDELKSMIIELANMQKKQNKTVRKSRPSGGTKIVVLPQHTSGGGAKTNDDDMEKLRKSIFD